MTQFILKITNPHSDVDFINSNSFDIDTTIDGDSGWCDASTGLRILSTGDTVLFSNVTTEQELALLLRYGDKIAKIA